MSVKIKKANPNCDRCHGRGWSISHRSDEPTLAIEKCDECDIYVDDAAAEHDALAFFERIMELVARPPAVLPIPVNPCVRCNDVGAFLNPEGTFVVRCRDCNRFKTDAEVAEGVSVVYEVEFDPLSVSATPDDNLRVLNAGQIDDIITERVEIERPETRSAKPIGVQRI